MSDPTQNPPPDDSRTPPPEQGGYGTTPPPPPPPPGGGYQPMPPSTQVTGGVGQPADLMPRFLARLIDYVLLTVVNGILVSLLIVGTLMGSSAGSFSGWGMGSGASWAASAVASVVTAAITLAYFAFLESSRGQTLGKVLLKLETRGPDGGRPTMEQAIKRNAFTAIGVLGVIPLIGFLAGLLSLVAVIMIAVTINKNIQTRRGWHDDFAGGTTVVKLA